MKWPGPYPPMPVKQNASVKENLKACEEYARYIKRQTEYRNYIHYWNRWFIKVYRWWSINVLGRDPKPYFDESY